MANDDYFVMVYRVLIYFYGCLKRKIVFSNEEFEIMIKSFVCNEYFEDILKMMNDEGYITGYIQFYDWNGEITNSGYDNIKITQKGIEYLQENSLMQKAKRFLLKRSDLMSKLINFI